MYSQWQVTMNDDVVIYKQLDDLKEQKRQLDLELQSLEGPGQDDMAVARLKKRKLQINDQILTLEFEVYPDQPA